MIDITPAWRDWYRLQHMESCRRTGQGFEDYVTGVLREFHDDFINPAPAGSLGDGGSDGLAVAGSVCYACFGYREMRDAERKLAAKIESDFDRAFATYNTFDRWFFVTNTSPGPQAVQVLTMLQQTHGSSSDRTVAIRLWKAEDLWDHVVGKLSSEVLNRLFPGAPGVAHLELRDLIPLMDGLDQGDLSDADIAGINPVPPDKVGYNDLPPPASLELNEGRLFSKRIEDWFQGHADPTLRDRQGQAFQAIYRRHRQVSVEPGPLLERVYVSLGGSDFRLDAVRANAVYAVTAYFFDACDIFEVPPALTLDEG